MTRAGGDGSSGRSGAGPAPFRSGTNPLRLSTYAASLFVAIGTVQLLASLAFYRAIDADTLREDHARRVAELLVVSDRVSRLTPDAIPAVMSSRHLLVEVTPAPGIVRPSADRDLIGIGRQIVGWESSLADKPLHLAIRTGGSGRRDLVGSMRMSDGRWLNFQSRDISSTWPIALRAAWMTLATTLVALGFGLMALRLLTRPLRRLSAAARAIGEGGRVAIREDGPTDLRNLASSMNEMQDRIARLLSDQAKSFEAISHDLRTPLARQKVAAGMVGDPEIGEILSRSADEMEAMLQSLQRYLRAQHLAAEPETVDLGPLLRDLAAAFAPDMRLTVPARASVTTYREPLLLALQALVENARHFGTRVDVLVEQVAGEWFVEIGDDGPGIPAERHEDVLAPFFRLDEARGRTVQGFGLGIPTAHRLLTRFGGGLAFRNAVGGGLVVRVRVPRPRS